MTEAPAPSSDPNSVDPSKQVRPLLGIPTVVLLALISLGSFFGGLTAFFDDKGSRSGGAIGVLVSILLWFVMIKIFKRIPQKQRVTLPPPTPGQKRFQRIWNLGIVLIALSLGAYAAYMSGLFKKAGDSAEQMHQNLVQKVIEEKCEIKNATWKQEGFFEWTITVNGWVVNKTSETVKATVVADIFSADRKLLLSKSQQVIIGPRESRHVEIEIPEAERKDQHYYKQCDLRISKVE